MIDWLQKEWYALASRYSQDDELNSRYWQDIVKHYSSKQRHYHNLSHIHSMLIQAENIKASIVDYDVLRFAIWYHDIIYKSTKKNNELKSAEFAQNCLKSFDFDEKRVKNVTFLINSTKNHNVVLDENEDNAYILDIDLSILGTQWNTYKTYIKNIRQEYAIYPDFMYNKGRKKVMLHFLDRKRIYFTKLYHDKFEVQARENIKQEIKLF